MDQALHGLREALRAEGAVVLSGLLPPAVCDDLRRAWETEVAPFPGPLPRQYSGRPEVHRRSPAGHVLNAVVDPRRLPFPAFASLEVSVMRASPIVALAEAALDAPPALIQAAYSAASPGVLTHHDWHPLRPGAPILGFAVALEDIGPDAGRFFWWAGSHDLPDDDPEVKKYRSFGVEDWRRHWVEDQPMVHLEESESLLAALVARYDLAPRVPALARGDAVAWWGHTLHGALAPTADVSRHTAILHFVELSTVAGRVG